MDPGEPKGIDRPLIVIHLTDGKAETILFNDQTEPMPMLGYAMLACDLVRHIAVAFHVPEQAVWDAVELERRNPTTHVGRKLNG